MHILTFIDVVISYGYCAYFIYIAKCQILPYFRFERRIFLRQSVFVEKSKRNALCFIFTYCSYHVRITVLYLMISIRGILLKSYQYMIMAGQYITYIGLSIQVYFSLSTEHKF